MSKDNLLSAYSDTPSFALWDGEHAILRLTGKVDRNFIKLDSKGKEQTYLGLECILIEHSNENYNHRHNTTCIFRIGTESTLAKWVNDERGGLKANNPRTIYRVDMSQKLGYSLRIESTERGL